MNNDVTVLVCSCDLYEDAWEPFFRLFKIMGADQCTNNPIILNTETKKYSCDYLQIKTVNAPPRMTWSQRLQNVLQQIDSEFIFLLLEDFFIQSPFNLQYFNKVVEYMRDHQDVGLIHTTPTGKYRELPDEMFFERKFESNNICVTAVLWRKDFLEKLLRPHENIWQFEWYSGIRARRYYSEKVMQYNERYPVIFDYKVVVSEGYGITERKWLPNNKLLFDKYGIEVNFDNLGWYVPKEKIKTKRTVFNLPQLVLKRIRTKISVWRSMRR